MTGSEILAARRSRGMDRASLAARTRLSLFRLAQIEDDDAIPTAIAQARIAEALRSPFEDVDDAAPGVRDGPADDAPRASSLTAAPQR